MDKKAGVEALRKAAIFSSLDDKALWLTAQGCFLGALLTAFLANAAISFYAMALPLFALGMTRGVAARADA